jgi:hypothetical protein
MTFSALYPSMRQLDRSLASWAYRKDRLNSQLLTRWLPRPRALILSRRLALTLLIQGKSRMR